MESLLQPQARQPLARPARAIQTMTDNELSLARNPDPDELAEQYVLAWLAAMLEAGAEEEEVQCDVN
jgi:hypothetical protein